jgi:hypothetical protein
MAEHVLTNERFRGIFKNNFDFANLAIALGRYYIKSGHEITLDSLLNEVKRNPSPNYVENLRELEDAE